MKKQITIDLSDGWQDVNKSYPEPNYPRASGWVLLSDIVSVIEKDGTLTSDSMGWSYRDSMPNGRGAWSSEGGDEKIKYWKNLKSEEKYLSGEIKVFINMDSWKSNKIIPPELNKKRSCWLRTLYKDGTINEDFCLFYVNGKIKRWNNKKTPLYWNWV